MKVTNLKYWKMLKESEQFIAKGKESRFKEIQHKILHNGYDPKKCGAV